jgi:hypothetical protein
VHFSSPRYLAISPKMRHDTGSTCLATCYTRTAYLQRHPAGCWRSQHFPESAGTWRARRTALCDCRGGNGYLSSPDNAPGGGDARHLSRLAP